jgi:hypothetical protein
VNELDIKTETGGWVQVTRSGATGKALTDGFLCSLRLVGSLSGEAWVALTEGEARQLQYHLSGLLADAEREREYRRLHTYRVVRTDPPTPCPDSPNMGTHSFEPDCPSVGGEACKWCGGKPSYRGHCRGCDDYTSSWWDPEGIGDSHGEPYVGCEGVPNG